MSKASDIVYGRQGGRFVGTATPKAKGWREDIACKGGPFAGTKIPIHTWGHEPGRVLEIHMSAGRYRLTRGVYVWEPEPDT